MAKKPPTPTVKQIQRDLENGNENNDNGNDNNGTGSNASNSGSDSTDNGQHNGASGGEVGSTSRATDGTDTGNNGDSGERAITSESSNGHSTTTASNAGTGTGTGDSRGSGKRGRGRPVGSKNRTGTERAEAETRTANDAPVGRTPRKVKDNTIEDEALANVPQTTRELIENVYAGLYWSVGQLTGYPQVWELKDGQETALASATEAMIKSLGKRKASKTLKAINEYFPGISLVVTALVITVPRIQITRQINNAKHINQNAPRGNNGTPTAGVDPTKTGVANDSGSGDKGNTEVSFRPVTASDFGELGERVFS